ncbi:MAG: alpha-amylase family protein [bacterium]
MPWAYFLLLLFGVVHPLFAETLTLPVEQRPAWLNEEGLVMAGSWEPLLFRVRRDGGAGYTPTPEQQDQYRREHSPEMIGRLKKLGVNFVMMHCYKGFGKQAEAESMAGAVRFARLCHEAGLRVGVYNYSGAFGWELFFQEVPQARDWVVRDGEGNPITYGGAAYRYYWNRNHPDALAFYKSLIRFAVRDIQADLLHFDNYVIGPGWDDNSMRRFQDYLRNTIPPSSAGTLNIEDLASLKQSLARAPDGRLRYAWLDFASRSLADSYHEMGRYARTLRPDILLECNPGGVSERMEAPVDHGRLLTGGEAFWDEGLPSGWKDGKLQTRICTYKVARRMDNLAFAYCTTPLELAESMAFNLNCLGCVTWFEYGNLVEKPGSEKPVSSELEPYIRFFHTRRGLFRDTRVAADIAVLRSFPSQMFADPRHAALTARVEQGFIENRLPFQIIFDAHLAELNRYRVLVLAGCVALSDDQITLIKQFVKHGGNLCILGEAGIFDEWMNPRPRAPFDDLPPSRVLRIEESDEFLETFRETYENQLSLVVDAPVGLCAELLDQPGRRAIHLVNFKTPEVMKNIAVRIRLPEGQKAAAVNITLPPREQDQPVPFEWKEGLVSFYIPEIVVYAIAGIQWQ